MQYKDIPGIKAIRPSTQETDRQEENRRPQFLSIANLARYQHYKKRNPPWVKLHWDLLSDEKFVMLSLENRALYSLLLLLASRHGNYIPFDPIYIQLQLKLTTQPDLTPLIHSGLVLAHCKRGASTKLDECSLPSIRDSEFRVQSSEFREEEDKDKEKEKLKQKEKENEIQPVESRGSPDPLDGFEDFWDAYPKKKNRGDAEKAWKKIKPNLALTGRMLAAIAQGKQSLEWTKDNGQFIPYPASWLNAKGWEDVFTPVTLHVDPAQDAGIRRFLGRA